MIANRIDIGEAPRIGPPRAEPTTFTYTGATALTPEQYQSQFVNYANQYVGLPSLEKETGISVTAPTVEEVQAGVQAREDDDDMPSFIKAGLDREEVAFGVDSISFSNDAKNYSSYVDYLKGTGKADRVDVVENLYSPIMEGNFKDIDLSEADLFRSLRDAPRELQEDIKGLSKTFEEEGVKGVVNKYGEPVAEKVLSSITGALAGPLVGAGVSGILGGTSEQNAFGKISFRPSGILGAFYDLNSARQFEDMALIRASEKAGLESGDYFADDRGFAMAIGNFGITRRPGANFYTGNRRGMSHKQIKDLEAISKGYLPESYRFTHDKDGQDSFFLSGDTKINQRISDDGGLMVDPNNPMAGFYKGDGTFYSPRFGYSKYGMRKDIQNLADKYGIDTTLAEQALEDARAGKGTLAGNIFKIKRDSADKDEKGESSFVPTSRPFQTTGSTSMDMIQQSIQNKKDEDDDKPTKKTESAQDFTERKIKDFQKSGNVTGGFNEGGFIGMNVGGSTASKSGFVDGVPPSQATDAQEVADDKEGKLPEGAYVINASAVTFAGETDIINMLREAQEEAVRRGVTPENPKASSMIDVAVSRGEVVVAPYLVNIIGKDRLEKINNRGVKDTERKIEENGQQVQGAAKGDLITVYRGEPLDPDRVGGKMDYGYGKEDVGKFHTPSVEKARRYTEGKYPFYGIESGNRVIKSRKVTVDELFEGVKEAWKTQAKVKTDYFSKMPKSELKKNLDFLDTLKEEVKSGKGRSINDVAFFLQEQVFHDDKSKINFIETFKNDPKTAFKLAGRAMTKIATKATPPIAFLEMAIGAFAPTTVADATLQGDESFLTR